MVSACKRVKLLVLVAFLIPSGLGRAQNQAATSQAKKRAVVWRDEFDGPNGSAVDPTKWVVETGAERWGNNELEYYTARNENVRLKDGNLVIEARAEKYKGPDGVTKDYTSARIKTLGKFSHAYGRFEARLKMPAGQGMWPAFWMMGDDIDRVGWPTCGEIDIMENIGKEPSVNHGSIHGPGYTGDVGIEARYTLPGGKKFSDDFHTYSIEWEPDVIRFYVDDALYATQTKSSLRVGQRWVFDHPFFLLLNVAVGGDWPGSPDASTKFPQTMLVDYVRIYGPSN